MRKEGVDHEPEEDFAEFYRACADACLRAVYASVGDRALAEDLTAEAFARAYASWPKVGRHPAPQAWVVRTALNTHVSWWRRRKREVAWDAGIDRADGGEPAIELDPAIRDALRVLPTRQEEKPRSAFVTSDIQVGTIIIDPAKMPPGSALGFQGISFKNAASPGYSGPGATAKFALLSAEPTDCVY